MEQFFEEFAALAEREGALDRSLVRQVLTQMSRVEAADRETVRRVVASLADALADGSERVELRSDLDATLASYTLLRLWTSALIEWTNREGRTPLGERVREMVEERGRAPRGNVPAGAACRNGDLDGAVSSRTGGSRCAHEP